MEQVQWKYLVFLVMGIISEIFISSKPGQLNTNIEFWNSVNLQIKVTPLQFSHLVVSNSLQPHESQHTRPSCPSPTLRVYPNSCPSSQWCHPAISSSVVPFSSRHQSLPTLESFQMSQLFHVVVKVLDFQLQHQSFQWIFRTDFL